MLLLPCREALQNRAIANHIGLHMSMPALVRTICQHIRAADVVGVEQMCKPFPLLPCHLTARGNSEMLGSSTISYILDAGGIPGARQCRDAEANENHHQQEHQPVIVEGQEGKSCWSCKSCSTVACQGRTEKLTVGKARHTKATAVILLP